MVRTKMDDDGSSDGNVSIQTNPFTSISKFNSNKKTIFHFVPSNSHIRKHQILYLSGNINMISVNTSSILNGVGPIKIWLRITNLAAFHASISIAGIHLYVVK